MGFFLKIIGRIKSIPIMMKDSSVSIFKKILVVFGVVYIFLPIDLIPPMLFPFGFIDDIILWSVILWCLGDTLDKYWSNGTTVDYSEKYKDAIIDDDFEVEEEDQKK